MNLSIWLQQFSPGTGHDPGEGLSVSDASTLDISSAASYVRFPGMYGDIGEDLC